MIPWLALLVALFLAPGAIALGSMLVAVAAGGADLLTRWMPLRRRQAAVLASVLAAGAAWNAVIVWIEFHAIEALPECRWAWPGLGGLVAAAPAVVLAWDMGRGEVDEALVAPLRLSAAANSAAVATLFALAIR